MLIKEQTCCFTGHRKLPNSKIEQLLVALDGEIERLIKRGVTTFISGGALGFDQVAASMVIAKKEMGRNIRLVFALPCKDQEKLWTSAQRKLYHKLLTEVDEVIYVSEEYSDDCMKKRNYYMVDHSAYCICALINPRSGTGQTVRYAMEKGVEVINLVSIQQ